MVASHRVTPAESLAPALTGYKSGAAPSLSSTMASKQLSAGHKEAGLNIALPVYFSYFLRGQVYWGMPPIGFAFECKVPHITEET